MEKRQPKKYVLDFYDFMFGYAIETTLLEYLNFWMIEPAVPLKILFITAG